ncbi:MAG: hypothetical protein OXN97_25480 [Bryobacterales bacterium]|nr:hypothetical protein [Bryobacterales bacterium]
MRPAECRLRKGLQATRHLESVSPFEKTELAIDAASDLGAAGTNRLCEQDLEFGQGGQGGEGLNDATMPKE